MAWVGGMICSYAAPTISNNIIERNVISPNNVAGLKFDRSSPLVVNCIVRDNVPIEYLRRQRDLLPGVMPDDRQQHDHGQSGAVQRRDRRLLFVSNRGQHDRPRSTAPGLTLVGSAGELRMRNSCVYGNTFFNFRRLPDPTGTNGNISGDPRFVRPVSAGLDGVWGTADDDGGRPASAAGFRLHRCR